ncbi:LPS assembly protein LptD [Thioalkalicoccus limnaeus]|uniref:LPS-assembly protein LptD n=1 Tax=Thioalkalicoccus limnaeus TaxID=120681 RepID=A0ABV4BJB6_9GAMM
MALVLIGLLLVPLGWAAAATGDETSIALPHDATRLYRNLDWSFCGPRPAGLGPAPAPLVLDEPLLVVDADDAQYDQDTERVTLRGRIEAERGDQRLESDILVYDRRTGEMTAAGRTFVEQTGLRLVGDRARWNLDRQEGRLADAQYRFSGDLNARGTAVEAEVVAPRLSRYRDITYTTCPPGYSDWSLIARTLTIDQEAGVGTARHARLRVGPWPVLYTPYLRFPIDGRRHSGFLVPTIGNSTTTGFDVTTPYYFNIAPAMDATLSPRYMSRRGLMLGGEWRFLTRRQSGEIYGEWLPRDQGTRDKGSRGLIQISHQSAPGRRWRTDLDLNQVSDARYLEDFGNRLDVTSVRNIERRGDLLYIGDGWRLLTRLQAFQTVDDGLPAADRPYGRLPQWLLDLDTWRHPSGFEVGGDLEYVYFAHDDREQGHRVALAPFMRYPLRRGYGHLIPQARLFGAGYSLSAPREPGASTSPGYLVPRFSLDGQLNFERTLQWFGAPALQTLEPRLFYLYSPYHDQDDIPLFDTTELSFGFSNLFRENRFTGRDRIGDANQLTLGLTSRTLDDRDGDERLRVSLGQILYFDQPQVRLTETTRGPRTSAIAGELAARLWANWTARASVQWDPNPAADGAQWEKRVVQLQYQDAHDRVLNLGYRFDLGTSPDTRYEDADLGIRWPVAGGVEVVGRWLYSLLHEETMEALAGIEFGRCCWRVRLVGHRFKNAPERPATSSIMLQFELAGLGQLGHPIDQFLEREIYGYRSD